ncbi:glycoside hydrolase domain-containing protein [Nocardia sp. NPDC057440]|uniref:glycoside hydrolase domain-containing protein n=1 Tax=Nocardia sp. NPDC057440 TaxID=3346134 RepID=UPI0036707781
MRLLDFSARLIEPEAIKAAGYGGVIGYFSESRPGANFGAKPLTRDYCDKLRSAGLEIVSNYQYGKGDTSDWKGGYAAGVRHAEIALRLHREAGGPEGRPIYAPVDSNPSLLEWNAQIAPFLRGWASVLGLDLTGVYCNSRCIDWALEDGVATWFWQHNWSGDPSINGDHPAAHLHQIEIDKRRIGGVAVDVNTALKPDYGQWAAASTESIGVPMKPEFDELDQTGISPNCHPRDGVQPKWFLLHTQEGNGSAQSLAGYLQNPSSGVSYHYTVDNDGVVVDVVDTDLASWSVLDANPRAINLCFAGSRAAWGPTQWVENMGRAIDIAAYLAVQDCRKYGIPPRVINADQLGRGESGIADHWAVTAGLGIGSHTDVGDGFPWERFAAAVDKYANTTLKEAVMSLADDELGKEFPSRSKYRADDEPVDTLAGYILNIDARIHEDYVEREARKGVEWAISLVRREADRGDDGAQATLTQIEGAK